jgi:hypothetical protein
MSVTSLSYVLNHVQVSSSEKFVLTVLAWHACTPHNIAWPSEKRLAHETGMTVRGVHRIIQKLCRRGALQVARKVRARGAHRYFIPTHDQQSPVILLTGDHGCERQATSSPLERHINTDKEIARFVPDADFLKNNLGLREDSEVFAWCLNGYTKHG